MPETSSELLERLRASDDPERAVLELTLGALDPEFARMVRCCALPRRLNVDVVAVLQADPSDRAAAGRVVDRIAQLSFVLRRADGDLVYHDTVRDRLVADWLEEENAPELARLTAALVEYYEARHRELADLDRALLRIGTVVRQANPDRHVQLTHALESRILAPLVEAVYHASLVSVEDAYSIFTRHVEDYEAAGRIGVCRALVSTLRERLVSIDSAEAANRLLWLRYWDARLLRASGEPDAADEILEEIDAGHDVRLRMWVLGGRGASLYERDCYRQAREVYEQELEIAQSTLADPWNLSVSYIRLGDLAWQIDELEESVEHYRRAVDAAARIAPGRNYGSECLAHLNLAGVLSQLGRFGEAFDTAFAALHIARTNLPHDRGLQAAVANRFLFLLAPWEPRLVETLHEEARVVRPPQEATDAAARSLAYLVALREARRALSEDEIRELAARPERDAVGAELLGRHLIEEAFHADARGEYELANRLYTALLVDGGATPWNRAAATTWRGASLASLGRLEQAAADYRAAAPLWQEMGAEVMTAVTRAYLAAVRVRQGRLGAAAAILDEWKPRFETIGGVLASPYYEALGELERARGDLAAAEDAHRTRFELLAAAERLEAGRAAAAVADVAALRADWETAAAWAERAADVWHRVGAAASYRQSPEEREADRQNGVAVRILTSPDGEIAAARDLLLAAGERVPWNMWYAINLGYAAAALGDFGEAADAFARASTHAPLQIDALTRLRAEYALRDAAGLLALGEAAQAAQACRSVLADAGPGLGADWYALLARSVGDAELRLGRPGAAAAEYAHALDAGEEWPELRGSTFGRLAVVEAERGRGDESAEFLRRAVDAYAEAGHGREAWWAAADAAAEVAPAPEPLLEQALLQVFDEQVEGGRVQTFRSSIEVAAPADWSVAESFTLTAQDGSGNLIVSGEPLAAPTTVDEYAALQRQHFESALHAFDEVSVTRFALPSGHDAIVRHYTWQTEDDVPITQFQAYVVDGGRGYTATGTTITGSGGLESRLLQLIHGIVLRNGAAET